MSYLPEDETKAQTNSRYRISIYPSGKFWSIGTDESQAEVRVMHLRDINELRDLDDLEVPEGWHRLDKLPEWMHERIAILSMLPEQYPAAIVVGVGRRISDNTYWIE